MTDIEILRIRQSEEYKQYMKYLCHLASAYVSRIRVQFAEKAFDMYQNETIRKIVFAYGKEAEDLEEHRMRDFRYASEYGAISEDSLDDWCLNNAKHYAETIWFLFEIK